MIVKGANSKHQDALPQKNNKILLICKFGLPYDFLIYFNLIIESDTAL